LWDLRGQPIEQFRNPGGSVTSIAFSPDGKNIISSSRDGTTRIWNLQGEIIQTISQSKDWKSLLEFACAGLRDKPILKNPKNNIAIEAKDTCQKYVWQRKQ
jgi:WD40 repeat protein